MANPVKAVPENVTGDLFVDSTCIDCDTCRQLAPTIFGEASNTAYVARQPTLDWEGRQAMQALVSCPTGSIGSRSNLAAKEVLNDFPLQLKDNVYYCGFNSPKSYGGNSYFVVHRDGNWLVDAPKFLPVLVKRFEQLGGLTNIFLTHRDDVADAAKYAEHFGARRFIHRLELIAQPGAEHIIDGTDAIELAVDLLAIPTPGHTAGHCCLLLAKRFLFSGDHLYFDRHLRRLNAFRDYCWDSWPEQLKSLRKLLDYEFEWVLPGHGQRVTLPVKEMHHQLAALVAEVGEGI